jgi:hypothetical protein
MKEIELRLLCEPLSEEVAPSDFYQKDVGSDLPLWRASTASDATLDIENIVAAYLVENPPHLTSVRFTDLTGGEPLYIRVSPTVEWAHEPTWNHIYKTWAELIERLIGKSNVCYLTGWPPKEYRVEIIRRSDNPQFPVLAKCTDEMISLGKHKREGLMAPWVWNYGAAGYILPEEEEHKIKQWASTKKGSPALVADFFETIYCMFWVKYELEGVWILSYKADSNEIAVRLGVEQINRELELLRSNS